MKKVISAADGQAAVSRVVRSISGLNTIRLSHLDCTAHRPVPDADVELNMTTELQVNASIQHSDDGSQMMVNTVSTYRVIATEESASDPIWTVNLVLVAHWPISAGQSVSEDDVHCFAIGQGAMTCHPYARELVQSATGRMGYPSATLDLLINPWSDGSIEIETDDE